MGSSIKPGQQESDKEREAVQMSGVKHDRPNPDSSRRTRSGLSRWNVDDIAEHKRLRGVQPSHGSISQQIQNDGEVTLTKT
jgi:hypothetical protein